MSAMTTNQHLHEKGVESNTRACEGFVSYHGRADIATDADDDITLSVAGGASACVVEKPASDRAAQGRLARRISRTGLGV